MIDSDIYRKALARYRSATGENTVFKDNVIVFLEKEIDCYREKIDRYSDAFRHMQYNVECLKGNNDKLKARLNAIYGVQTAGSIMEQLEEWTKETEQREKIQSSGGDDKVIFENWEQFNDALNKRIEQIRQTFTKERTGDRGRMTLATHTKYEEVQDILLHNGYFVTSHFDDENSEDETITIEFWKE